MPGSRVNLGMGQPGRKPAKARAAKKAKGTAVKKAKGGAAMEPPVGMTRGGGANARRRDHTTPVGAYKKGGEPKKKKPPKPPAPPGKGPGRTPSYTPPIKTADIRRNTTRPPTTPPPKNGGTPVGPVSIGDSPGRPPVKAPPIKTIPFKPIKPPTKPTSFVKGTRQGTAVVPDESGGRGRLNPPKKGSAMVQDSGRKKVVKRAKGGSADNSGLKEPSNEGLKKLPEEVRNKMGYKKMGGPVKKSKGGSMRKMAKGGSMYKKGKKSGPKP